MEDLRIPNRDLNFLYPDIRVRYFRICEDMKNHFKPVVLNEGYRSHARQVFLYEQGRTMPGPIVTKAMPGSSLHQYGLAIDLKFVGPDPYGENMPWEDLHRIAHAHGFETLTWEKPHLQLTYGLTLGQIRSLYEYNGISAVWCALDRKRGDEPGQRWMPLAPELALKNK